MPDIYETKRKDKRDVPTPVPKRMCLNCGRTYQMSQFYSNKNWEEQAGKDIWCKTCVSKLASKNEARKYFWYNNRDFTPKIWNTCLDRATQLLINNSVYQKSNDDRKQVMLQRMACQQLPSVMTMNGYYNFVDHSKESESLTYEEAVKNGEIIEEDENHKQYSDFFNGNFTKRELAYLQKYYKKLGQNRDFESDESLKDYARKISRLSLLADKVQDDYAAGKCSFSEVKDILSQFDMMNKSSNFAACRRKEGEGSGLTSWGQFALKWQTSGIDPKQIDKPIKWEEDDVDRCINSLRHLAQSLNLDTM